MSREWSDYLCDILTSIQETEDFTSGMSFHSFASDRKTVNAVIRSLEVMGEAAKNVPDDVREMAPSIPWKRMAGMRDKLIHEYSGVDLEIVWAVVNEEIPSMKPAIEKLVSEKLPTDERLR